MTKPTEAMRAAFESWATRALDDAEDATLKNLMCHKYADGVYRSQMMQHGWLGYHSGRLEERERAALVCEGLIVDVAPSRDTQHFVAFCAAAIRSGK